MCKTIQIKVCEKSDGVEWCILYAIVTKKNYTYKISL